MTDRHELWLYARTCVLMNTLHNDTDYFVASYTTRKEDSSCFQLQHGVIVLLKCCIRFPFETMHFPWTHSVFSSPLAAIIITCDNQVGARFRWTRNTCNIPASNLMGSPYGPRLHQHSVIWLETSGAMLKL